MACRVQTCSSSATTYRKSKNHGQLIASVGVSFYPFMTMTMLIASTATRSMLYLYLN